MMIRVSLKRIYAALLVALLLAVQGGQQVHIYTEDLLHFAAFGGDLMEDNGADCGVAERCIVDDYYFFPFLQEFQSRPTFYSGVLAVLQPEAVHCICVEPVRTALLRAPPAA